MDFRKINFIGGGRNWIILVFSLLLAFFMWSIMKLSDNYASYIKYRVEVTSNIEGRRDRSQSTDVLLIGAKSSGFKILQNIDGEESNTLLLENIDAKYFHKYHKGDDLFYVIPNDIKQSIQDALGADITIEMLATDTLFFDFPKQSNRKVPVVPSVMVTYAKQYMPYSSIVLKPDSVLIYGDESLISLIDEVTTEPIKDRNVEKAITGIVGINPLPGVRISEKEVFYTQEVGRYVEHSLKVPVTLEDAPSYANVAIIPQEVTVRYRQPFESVHRYSAKDFVVGVEYGEVLRKDVVKVHLSGVPQGVLQVEIEPKFVECVL